MRQLGPPYPRFQCCGLGIEWRVFPRAKKMTFFVKRLGAHRVFPRAKKMTFFVNRLGAHHDNIEIEGAGVGVRGLSHKLPGVIFFANTRVSYPLFSNKNTHANLAFGSRHTVAGRRASWASRGGFSAGSSSGLVGGAVGGQLSVASHGQSFGLVVGASPC